MKHPRKPAKPKPDSRPPSRQKGTGSLWVVLIDETPLRAAALAEHRALEDQASRLRERLERFETADIPAYTRWEATTLGPLLTRIRETDQAIAQKRAILEAVEDEQFFTNCSRLAAYRRVMKRVAAGGDPFHDPMPEGEPETDPDAFREGPSGGGDRLFGEHDLPPGFDVDEFDRLSAIQKREFREQYDLMAEMFEMLTGGIAPPLDELLRAARQKNRGERKNTGPEAPAPKSEKPRPSRQSSRLKELYRQLVRKLHPDHNPDQTSRERELWHTVQQAYQRGDVESLEAVAARVELGLDGQASKLSISLLRRLVHDLRDALRALKGKLSAARKHAAWDFAAKQTGLDKLEAKHRKELLRHLHSLQVYLAALNLDLETLAERAGRPTKTQRQKTRAKSAAFHAQQEFSQFDVF